MLDGSAESVRRRGFLSGGGEMGARLRALDGAATPLGPIGDWPASLRTAVRLILNSPQPMMVMWGPALLQIYNDAYAELLGPERHPAMLGQPCAAWWQEAWDVIAPQVAHVLAGLGGTWRADQLIPITRDGRRADAWWTYSYNPIDDEGAPAGVGGVLVICQDVTEQHRARQALRAGEARWRGMFEAMQEGFVLCELVRDAAGRAIDVHHLESNAAAARLTGISAEAAPGRLGCQVLPGMERHWLETYARVVETGEPAHAVVESAPLGRWFEVFAYRTEPERFAVLFLDVTARRQSEARQALLTREVDHRAKNLLAVVQAAVQLTRADSLEEYRRVLTGRLGALARTQTLLAAGSWGGADLRAIIEGELDGTGAGGRAALDGPSVQLPATVAQPLAMALHELATNAARHGALSVPGGRLELRWQFEGKAPWILLHWRERGGPKLAGVPARRGFGTRVLEATVRGQLGGEVALDWDADGLDCRLRAPLQRAGEVPELAVAP